MIRYLTERLPVMVCPQWVYTRVQPIAVDDLQRYLVAALDVPDNAGRVVEVGGVDVLTYGDMMLGYAEARGLWRHLQPVPVLTPKLSSYWVHLVTPIPSQIARPLIEGLRNETVVRDHSAHDLFPAIHPVGYATAVRAAVASLDTGEVETSWADALVTSGGDVQPRVLTTQEGKLIERRQALVVGDAKRRSPSCAPSVAGAATVPGTGPGSSAAPPTGWSAAWGCAAAAATPTICASATRSTSGASRRSSPAVCCASGRR